MREIPDPERYHVLIGQFAKPQAQVFRRINRDLYIHRKDWQHTEKKRRLKAWLALRDHRARVCLHYDITPEQYQERFDAWCYLRRLMEERREQARAQTDRKKLQADHKQLNNLWKQKIAARAARAAQLVLEGIEPPPPCDDLRSNFAAYGQEEGGVGE